MNRTDRLKMVKAMEFICRNLNDESIFYDIWLQDGIADGDIRYGDLDVNSEDGTLDYYIKDDNFADVMHTFIYCIWKCYKSGGLYCDDICSK